MEGFRVLRATLLGALCLLGLLSCTRAVPIFQDPKTVCIVYYHASPHDSAVAGRVRQLAGRINTPNPQRPPVRSVKLLLNSTLAQMGTSSIDSILSLAPSGANLNVYFGHGAGGLDTRRSFQTLLESRLAGRPHTDHGDVHVDLEAELQWGSCSLGITLAEDDPRIIDWRQIAAYEDVHVWGVRRIPFVAPRRVGYEDYIAESCPSFESTSIWGWSETLCAAAASGWSARAMRPFSQVLVLEPWERASLFAVTVARLRANAGGTLDLDSLSSKFPAPKCAIPSSIWCPSSSPLSIAPLDLHAWPTVLLRRRTATGK
eukprot:m.204921 g.204921  ORF g.204921 m.204921 type:complete len:316 (+) comp10700_c0_seq4:136-1083(+)